VCLLDFLILKYGKLILEIMGEVITNLFHWLWKMASVPTSLPLHQGAFTFDGKSVITNFYATNPKQLEVLLGCAIEAATCTRAKDVYQYWPPELEAQATAHGEPIYKFISKMGINIASILDILSKTPCEGEFMHSVGENVYIFIKFTILTTKQYFTTTNKLFPEIVGGKLMQFKMIHNAASEARFAGKSTRFFCHGSGYENWDNIFREGLKATSGVNAKLMVNANAYGAGIYLSDSPALSLSYTHSRCGKNEVYMMAICEVITDAAVQKTSNIFLLTDESAIIIRYIICFDKAMFSNPEFTKQIPKVLERLNSSTITNANRHKRLTGELGRMIMPAGVSIQPVCTGGRFTTSWSVKYTDFDKFDSILVHQLRSAKIESVEVEFIFGSNFPYSPPFMRLVSPRLKFNPDAIVVNPELGFLDSGGGICTAMFKTGDWTAGLPLIHLIGDIQFMLFMTNGLELDPKNWAVPYDVREALTSFNTVIGTFEMDDAIDLLDSR
jgi:ubiquitin-protein ligase